MGNVISAIANGLSAFVQVSCGSSFSTLLSFVCRARADHRPLPTSSSPSSVVSALFSLPSGTSSLAACALADEEEEVHYRGWRGKVSLQPPASLSIRLIVPTPLTIQCNTHHSSPFSNGFASLQLYNSRVSCRQWYVAIVRHTTCNEVSPNTVEREAKFAEGAIDSYPCAGHFLGLTAHHDVDHITLLSPRRRHTFACTGCAEYAKGRVGLNLVI